MDRVQKNWEKLARTDPFWAVLSWDSKKGNKWNQEEFFKLGRDEIADVLGTVKKFNTITFGSALDFGSGLGRLAEALGDYFQKVVGVDISESMVREATKLSTHTNVRYITNTVPDLHILPDDSFDFIYTRLTLQHMPPRYMESYLQEFSRIIKPGGSLVCIIPSRTITWGNVKAVRSIDDLLNLILPDLVLNLLRYTIGFFQKSPVMEMHSMNPKRVISFINNSHLQLLNVSEYGILSPGWASNRYIVTKQGAPL